MNRHGVGADAVVDAAIAGVACAESRTDIGCGKVRTGAAPCRKRLARVTARILRERLGFLANGPCDTVTKAERFFHDVSQYGGSPLTPSKISMMIICP